MARKFVHNGPRPPLPDVAEVTGSERSQSALPVLHQMDPYREVVPATRVEELELEGGTVAPDGGVTTETYPAHLTIREVRHRGGDDGRPGDVGSGGQGSGSSYDVIRQGGSAASGSPGLGGRRTPCSGGGNSGPGDAGGFLDPRVGGAAVRAVSAARG